MTPDKKRAILEATARACGLPKHVDGMGFEQPHHYKWNPIYNSADTANMCAKLDIDTYWFPKKNLVLCCRDGARTRYQHDEKHDGTPEGKEAAWRLAASMVAAKVGGYTDDI